MRRAALVVCLLTAVAVAALLGGGGEDSTGAAPPLKPLVALGRVAIPPGRFIPRSGVPGGPCFRDSPGGPCRHVCIEFAQTAAPPRCPPRATAGRLVPVAIKP